ncbi:siphovirus Gp157 family protein [Peptoniphilus sp. HCN-40583]|uniref:siphovirus Gp157 family protein n=1 Tax=Peptoniphilus sp. HCN-40583 TaxID=3134662 RepID=UPI0030C3B1D0
MRLYEITEAYANLEAIEDDVDVSSALANVEGALEDKLESIAKVIKNLDAMADAYEDEERRLRTKKQAAKKRVDGLKRYVKDNLEAIGKDKVEAGIFKWSLQYSPPKLVITDESLIPEEFFVIERKPIKSEIKKAIEAEQAIDGAEIVREKHLRLR